MDSSDLGIIHFLLYSHCLVLFFYELWGELSFELLLDLGLQVDSNDLFAIEHIHGYLVCKVILNDAVQDFQSFGYGSFFDRVVR